MSSFDDIERSRERDEGLAYEDYWDRRIRDDEEYEDDAYELDDPKHPTFAERYADAADLARKRAKGE